MKQRTFKVTSSPKILLKTPGKTASSYNSLTDRGCEKNLSIPAWQERQASVFTFPAQKLPEITVISVTWIFISLPSH